MAIELLVAARQGTFAELAVRAFYDYENAKKIKPVELLDVFEINKVNVRSIKSV